MWKPLPERQIDLPGPVARLWPLNSVGIVDVNHSLNTMCTSANAVLAVLAVLAGPNTSSLLLSFIRGNTDRRLLNYLFDFVIGSSSTPRYHSSLIGTVTQSCNVQSTLPTFLTPQLHPTAVLLLQLYHTDSLSICALVSTLSQTTVDIAAVFYCAETE